MDRNVAMAWAAAGGIQLTKEQQEQVRGDTFTAKVCRLWVSNNIRCKCGMPLKMGRGKSYKEVDNPAYKAYTEDVAAGRVTIEMLSNKPAFKLRLPNPNYNRFWYMCSKGTEQGGSCNGSFVWWDALFNGFMADERFKLFRFMVPDAAGKHTGMESKPVPDTKTYDAVMALPDDAVRTHLDPIAQKYFSGL